MRLTVVGCGDAFGSGGRLQTCFHVDGGSVRFLLDCGATTMTGLAREGIDPNTIPTIVISHLHGDHFAGLVWFLLHAQHPGKRREPLTIVGPRGLKERFLATSELLFPGSTAQPPRFETTYVEFDAGDRLSVGGLDISVFEGQHPSGALSSSLRISVGGRVLSFSGDTEWVDALVDCARGADLFITECYAPAAGVRYHLDWETLSAKFDRLTASRILVTHMNPAMLAHAKGITRDRLTFAHDGLVVEV